MKKEAEAHAEDDKKKKELIEARNMADTLVYTSEKAIKDAGDKLTADEKKDIEDKIAAVREVSGKDDKDAISKASDALSEAVQKVGQRCINLPSLIRLKRDLRINQNRKTKAMIVTRVP
jgi:molecular chaperone DnaK